MTGVASAAVEVDAGGKTSDRIAGRSVRP